ncbi:CoA pyrophosphatase [Litorimonas sp. RW-G-Af-16]|uniref:CoA pyrophosphatase n=1 Tax=Litorimonas sp. RW-G-Af-16 TaxID=3241168 RepID=UPI00390CB0E5
MKSSVAQREIFADDPTIGKIASALLPLKISDGTDKQARKGQRMAAVLMPLVKRDTWNIILTQRPETMPSHAGQVAFPGGKVERGETTQNAALRETEEEIGVRPEAVKLLGRLESFNAVSDFRITPFVGIVDPSAKITPDPHEVADVFEVPLAFIMNPANHVERNVEFEGRNHRLWDMPYTSADGVPRNIWGMTAMTMYRLYQRAYLGIFETDF